MNNFNKKEYIINFPSTDHTGYSGYIRSYLPAKIFNNKSKTIKMCCSNKLKVNHPIYINCNTVIFNRICTNDQLFFIKKYIEKNKKLIYSVDDNLFELPEYNYANIWYDTEKLENALKIIDISEKLIVQNNDMKQYCVDKKHIDPKKIKILENRLSKIDWADKAVKHSYDFKTKPKILFTGSSSYNMDFRFLLPLIEKTHEKYEWHFTGFNLNHMMLNDFFRNIKIVDHGWIPTPNYSKTLQYINPDVILFPKIDNIFNRCRSSSRVFEASALNVPIISTKFEDGWKEAYSKITRKLNIKIWENAIDDLIADKLYYRTVVEEQKDMLEKNWLEDYIKNYFDIFKNDDTIESEQTKVHMKGKI